MAETSTGGLGAPRIAIVGGGIGGLAAGVALRKFGLTAEIFEQASRYARVGADINLTPNAVRAVDGLGVGAILRETAARPTHRISRMWDTVAETSRLPMSDEAEQRYGAPQLTLHRADLIAALDDALPDGAVRTGCRVVDVVAAGTGATLHFADGARETFDVVIGADGIHSVIRAYLFGEDRPRFTGVVAYRTIVPMERLWGPNREAFTKWWGQDPETQLVTFPLSRGREMFIFATTAQYSWRHESWTTPGSVAELRETYRAFHPDARAMLDAADEVLKTALYERDPLPSWSRGGVTLLGDACHPMMPFMAQGAGQALEDAVVLARCLGAMPGIDCAEALRRYERARLDRTGRIQLGSRGNQWLRDGGNADWVYGYNAWSVALA